MFGQPDITDTTNSDYTMDAAGMADAGASEPMASTNDDQAQHHDQGSEHQSQDTSTSTHSDATMDDLLSIKQSALTALTPLVNQLDQSPEEKFKTTMMMIQASDDKSMVRSAYEAAQGISDEKTRAQALLDVINEINYFTSQSQ